MITANRQAFAGPCVNGKRHRWGKETNRRGGVCIWYDEPCLKCNRIRVRIYTRSGNRIDGYETRS